MFLFRAVRARLLHLSNDGKIREEKVFSSSTPLSKEVAVSSNAIIVASKDGTKGCTGYMGGQESLSCMSIPGSKESRTLASGAGIVRLSSSSQGEISGSGAQNDGQCHMHLLIDQLFYFEVAIGNHGVIYPTKCIYLSMPYSHPNC